MEFEKIGDTLIDQNFVLNKKYSMELHKYQNTIKFLGYLSKIKHYELEYCKVKTQLSIMRKHILTEYHSILTEDNKKYLFLNPCLCKEFRQGENSFDQLKNYMIYHYRRKLYIALDSDDNMEGKVKTILDEIVKQDNYFDIYTETIGSFLDTNEYFNNIMRKKFAEYIYF
jgi:hypothetical protein